MTEKTREIGGVPKKRFIIEFDGLRWGIVHSDLNVLEIREIARELLEIFSGKVGAVDAPIDKTACKSSNEPLKSFQKPGWGS